MKVYILIHEGDNSSAYTFKEILDVSTTEEMAKKAFEENKYLVEEIRDDMDEEDYEFDEGDEYLRVDWDGYYDSLYVETWYTRD